MIKWIVAIVIAMAVGFGLGHWANQESKSEAAESAPSSSASPSQSQATSQPVAERGGSINNRATPVPENSPRSQRPANAPGAAKSLLNVQGGFANKPPGVPVPISLGADIGAVEVGEMMNINLGNGGSQVEIVDVRSLGESRSVRGRIAPQTGANGASLQGMVALTIRGDRLSGTIATNQGLYDIFGTTKSARLMNRNMMMGEMGGLPMMLGSGSSNSSSMPRQGYAPPAAP